MRKNNARISEKDLERVLVHCFNNAGDSAAVYKPDDSFFESVIGLTDSEVMIALSALNSKGVVALNIADYPESRNIYAIELPDKAYEYLVERNERRRAYWKNWRWNIWAAVATAVISALLGALLARVSQIIWP